MAGSVLEIRSPLETLFQQGDTAMLNRDASRGDAHAARASPPPSGPFVATRGPPDGPILR